ncbi:hypothetical protein BX616_008701, partial [Lobosporangium transversale]
LAAGSVLSVLQCPPPPPVFRTSALFCKSPALTSSTDAANGGNDVTSPPSPSCSTSSTSSCSSTTSEVVGEQRPSLIHFLRNICVKASVTELALVISLIYVDRLKKALTNMAR